MSSIRRFLCLFFAAIFVLAASLVSAQDAPSVAIRKIDRSLRESLKNGARTHRVIVTVKPGYRADIRKALESHGDVINADSPLIDALAVEVHTEDVAELAKHPWIELISEDAIVRPNSDARDVRRHIDNAKRKIASTATATTTTVTEAPLAPSTLRQTLGLPRTPSSSTMQGRSIVVAIVDSGIAPNSDFGNRITAFYDFTKGGVSTTPSDEYGHGTHVAGLIGSSGALSSEMIGVAPQVQFVGVKVLNKKGEGNTSDVIKAIEYITANKSRLNIRVMNLSLGHPIYAPAQDDPLVRAVEKASAAGIVVVAAAGNYGTNPETGVAGYTGITSPGNAPSVITVGAVNTQNTVSRLDDVVAPYSSRGPSWFDGFAKPNVLAPGTSLSSDTDTASYLYTLLANNRKKASNGKKFLALSGTSMAAAVTSGVVAVVLEASDSARDWNAPALSPNAVKAILEYSAIPVAGADSLTQGTGSINAAGAIALASAIDTGKSTGNWWLRSGVNAYTYLDNVRYDWSKDVIWGDRVLTGNLVYYRESAWSVSTSWDSDNIVWGTNHAQSVAQNIVWGTTAVWASNIVWPDRVLGQMVTGNNIVWGTNDSDNIVWGTVDSDNIVWGTWDGDNIVWGTWDGDNIVWGTNDGDNIIWGTDADNIVWGTDDDNIIWGTAALLGGIF